MSKYVNWKGRDAIASFKRAAQAGVYEAAVIWQMEAKRLLGLRSSNRGKTPSPPGQPPALDTGTLRRSVYATVTPGTSIGWSRAKVGSPLRYGAVHEFGGRYHPRRPWLFVAQRLAAVRMRRAIAKRLKGVVLKFGTLA